MNSMSITKKNHNAFTLTEILFVMLITSILVLGINAAFSQAHMLWSRVESQRPVYQKTRLFFDTLQEELSCLYLPKTDDKQQQSAPFSLSFFPNDTVGLSFFTLNPAWKDTVLSNLPAKVSYIFTADTDSGRKILSRVEQLFSGEKAVSPEQKETILEGFTGITIHTTDPNTRSLADSWKSELQCSQRPPRAVKILLKWPKDEQMEIEFETIIKIACQGQITPP